MNDSELKISSGILCWEYVCVPAIFSLGKILSLEVGHR